MTALPLTVTALLVFVGLAWGGGLPLARRLPLPPTLRFVLTPFVGLLGLYLVATVAYLWAGGVTRAFPLLVGIALIGWTEGHREWRQWNANLGIRRLAGLWLVVTTVALLWLGLVRNYSGGDWIGDWAGHYHRASYFLDPSGDWDWMFAKDPLAGRPPLQNLVTAAFLRVGLSDFAAYQVFTLLLGSLVVLPLGLLVLGRESETAARALALRWLGALLLCSPLLMQNLTYPWTKMGTNAWILLAVLLGWSTSWHPERRALLTVLAAVALAAAVLAHYSAAVYVVVLVPTFWWWSRQQLPARVWLLAGAAAGLVLVSWFGWAATRGGASDLVGSTTTSQALTATPSLGAGLAAFGENLARTFVPHPLLPRPPVGPPPTDLLARWRDFWFQLYQTNLLWALGSVTLVALLLARARPLRSRLALPVAALVVVGIVVHPAISHWGLAHICLQPLVLLAWVWSARWLATPPTSRRRWMLPLLGLDFACGIGLHFAVESLPVPASVLAWQDGAPLVATYGQALRANAGAKEAFLYQFLGDMTATPVWLTSVLALAIVGAWIGWLLRSQRSPTITDGAPPATD